MISIVWHDDLIDRCDCCSVQFVGGYQLSVTWTPEISLCLECVDALRRECEAALSEEVVG